jgi:hypothetical protein
MLAGLERRPSRSVLTLDRDRALDLRALGVRRPARSLAGRVVRGVSDRKSSARGNNANEKQSSGK